MKSILITGATGGLGHAVAARLARDYRCIALYRSESSWNELRKSVAIDGVANVEEINEPLYGLVLLAGAFAKGSAVDVFETMMEANLMSAVRAIEPLRARIEDGGRIVAISSAASKTHPRGLGAYVASKSALNAYIEALARDLEPRKITVNALLPTALDTPAMRDSMPSDRLVPLDRVSDAIASLLSDASASISGQMFVLSR